LDSPDAAQTKTTTATLQQLHQLLDYASTYPDAKVRFLVSPMILTLYSNASYLSEAQARTRVCYLSSKHDPATPAPTNGAVHVTSVIIKHAMSSVAEAELADLFYIEQDACSIRFTLENAVIRNLPLQSKLTMKELKA
jgi:hypothetical protein